jgi:hypothetical protein
MYCGKNYKYKKKSIRTCVYYHISSIYYTNNEQVFQTDITKWHDLKNIFDHMTKVSECWLAKYDIKTNYSQVLKSIFYFTVYWYKPTNMCILIGDLHIILFCHLIKKFHFFFLFWKSDEDWEVILIYNFNYLYFEITHYEL